jgi:hypothetical protein
MVWVVENMVVDGLLSVAGAEGQHVNTLNSAPFPAAGGRAGAGGGDGGSGSPQIAHRSFAGQSGNGPGNTPGLGGTGGLVSLVPGCGRGSGGGGGAFATTGDPHYPQLAGAGTSFQQQLGLGGQGCQGASGAAPRSLPGGGPGGTVFVDGRGENDFFGVGYDVFRQRVIVGELPLLVGGAGGGGGGDLANSPGLLSPTWQTDSVGGGGGGGGGCLVVFARTGIQVTGRITANGGHGGGGEQAGSCNQGGGGGGGSGGLLILATLGSIVLDVRGETYANRDYDFVLSADGGVCTTGTFAPPVVAGKYPPNGQVPQPGASYDSAPLGGFGGMGVLQLVTPAGNNSDGTNTVLDDNVVLRRNGVPLTGALKQRFLAWRGYPDANGTPVDDFGVPTNVGAREGDIRPSPVLLPVF